MIKPCTTSVVPLCLVAALVACAPRVQLPELTDTEIDDAVANVATKMIDELVDVRSRLLDLEYRLTKTAVGLCNVTLAHPGVLITRQGAYEHEGVKAAVSSRVAATEDLTIVHVVPGGPFSRAGLRAGDRVLTIDGRALRTTEDFSVFLFDFEGQDPVRVGFQRPGEEAREIEVQLDHTCPVLFRLATSAMIVPWRDGLVVSVPLGLMRYARSDDELAVALGHQLAHVLFDQPDDDEFEGEAGADRRGLRIAAAAGYDISKAASYWEGVAIEYPWLALPSRRGGRPRANQWRARWQYYDGFPHHDIARRMDGIRSEVDR
jgi:hypothetical protein